MRADEVKAIVEREIAEFRYDPPEGGTIGVPWSFERVASELDMLRTSLVYPQLTTIEIGPPDLGPRRQLWVVTRTLENKYLVVFDPDSRAFGLAAVGDSGPPETVAVWGDLVSTFMAR